MPKIGTWIKMFVTGTAICVGGPAFVEWIRPTDEELFKRYNPDLQKKSLANRNKNEEEFDEFVRELKEMSKSDKPIWVLQKEKQERLKKEKKAQEKKTTADAKERRETMRREAGLSN